MKNTLVAQSIIAFSKAINLYQYEYSRAPINSRMDLGVFDDIVDRHTSDDNLMSYNPHPSSTIAIPEISINTRDPRIAAQPGAYVLNDDITDYLGDYYDQYSFSDFGIQESYTNGAINGGYAVSRPRSYNAYATPLECNDCDDLIDQL